MRCVANGGKNRASLGLREGGGAKLYLAYPPRSLRQQDSARCIAAKESSLNRECRCILASTLACLSASPQACGNAYVASVRRLTDRLALPLIGRGLRLLCYTGSRPTAKTDSAHHYAGGAPSVRVKSDAGLLAAICLPSQELQMRACEPRCP